MFEHKHQRIIIIAINAITIQFYYDFDYYLILSVCTELRSAVCVWEREKEIAAVSTLYECFYWLMEHNKLLMHI